MHLVNMERALNLNNFQPKQALYRGMDEVEGNMQNKPKFLITLFLPGIKFLLDIDKKVVTSEEDMPNLMTPAPSKEATSKNLMTSTMMMSQEVAPSVERLWTYSCQLTRGRNVSCIAWCKANEVEYLTLLQDACQFERIHLYRHFTMSCSTGFAGCWLWSV